MIACSRCNTQIEQLFTKNNNSYYHCDSCHMNYKKNQNHEIININYIVSHSDSGKTSSITPGYSSLVRKDQKKEIYKCTFCEKKSKVDAEYLYTSLFLFDEDE
jgi:hypothetical protein